MIAAGIMEFQSTRPVWGATTEQELWERQAGVSIHAPRVGRDTAEAARKLPAGGFNPRAPCGARQTLRIFSAPAEAFQSTRPVWGATLQADQSNRSRGSFNPRAPCGARHNSMVKFFRFRPFQSTRPVWGATRPWFALGLQDKVSIHAPRVGRDPCQSSEQ